MRGKLITFEGIEGCGKTTQIDLVCRELASRGKQFLRTREPGGTAIGEQIRKILLNPDNRDIVDMTELLLYAADRAQHVKEVISPALDRRITVLCDRYTDATLAYQGYGRGLDRETIEQLNQVATGGVKPDLTFLIDIPVDAGLARAIRRNQQTGVSDSEGRFEEEALAFHSRIRDGYFHLAAMEPDRFRIVDGDQSPAATNRQILSELEPLLE
jgi:dTMP kinase